MIFLPQKKFVWQNEVVLGLRVLRKWFAIQLNGSFAFTKASSVVDSAATEEFEYTAVRNVKVGSACFSLEENLKLYFNGKYSVPVIFLKHKNVQRTQVSKKESKRYSITHEWNSLRAIFTGTDLLGRG